MARADFVFLVCCLVSGLAAHTDKKNEMQLTPDNNKLTDIDCGLCEVVIKELDSYLADNATQSKIQAALLKFCADLPSTELKEACNTVVMLYLKLAIKEIVQTSPLTICTEIGLCTALSPFLNRWETNEISLKRFLPSKQNSKDDVPCTLCQVVVKRVESYAGSPAVMKKLNSSLTMGCLALTQDLKACLTTAQTLLKMIKTASSMSSQVVCGLAGLCKQGSYEVQFGRGSKWTTVECSVCHEVVSALDTYLYDNKDFVKQELDTFCHRLPSPTDQQCLKAIDPNFEKYFELFIKEVLNETMLCDLAGACHNQRAPIARSDSTKDAFNSVDLI